MLEAISNLRSDLKPKIKLFVLSNENIEIPSNINSQHIIPKSSEDISNFYNSFNLFIFGSYEEGFGLPPLEALASGCLVISSDCGGVRTFLNETNSLLFRPGDSSELTKKIEFSLDYPSQIIKLRKMGIINSKEFSLEIVMNKYYNLIKKNY